VWVGVAGLSPIVAPPRDLSTGRLA
jgi:hypothetical protein